jgi:hypothetical protein
MSEKVKTIHVFLGQEMDGIEGIIGQALNGLYMPFVCVDAKSIELMRPLAKKIGQQSGRVIKLVKFSVREELEIIEPKG